MILILQMFRVFLKKGLPVKIIEMTVFRACSDLKFITILKLLRAVHSVNIQV